MILRSLPLLEQAGKLNLSIIIIMRVFLSGTSSPSNPWFPMQGITANLFSLTLFCFWGLRLWTSDEGISEHLLNFSAFTYSLNLASKTMKIENSWQINKVICILLESYFFLFFTYKGFILSLISLPGHYLTWVFSCSTVKVRKSWMWVFCSQYMALLRPHALFFYLTVLFKEALLS